MTIEEAKKILAKAKRQLMPDGWVYKLLHPEDVKKIYKLLEDQKNLIDGLIEDQLKKDEEQQAEIDRLKALVKKKNRKIKKLMEDNYLNGGR